MKLKALIILSGLLLAAGGVHADKAVHVELAGVTDVYGDATGLIDSVLEWSSVSIGLQGPERGYYFAFHAGPVVAAAVEMRQVLWDPSGRFTGWFGPRLAVDLQLDEPNGGDIYLGGAIGLELWPSRRLGYYIFATVDGWLNTFGGSATENVMMITVPIGVGFRFPSGRLSE